MKTLFNDKLELNSEGMKLSTKIQNVLKIFGDTNKLNQLNPIEVEWIINSEVSIFNSNMYAEYVMSTYKLKTNS